MRRLTREDIAGQMPLRRNLLLHVREGVENVRLPAVWRRGATHLPHPGRGEASNRRQLGRLERGHGLGPHSGIAEPLSAPRMAPSAGASGPRLPMPRLRDPSAPVYVGVGVLKQVLPGRSVQRVPRGGEAEPAELGGNPLVTTGWQEGSGSRTPARRKSGGSAINGTCIHFPPAGILCSGNMVYTAQYRIILRFEGRGMSMAEKRWTTCGLFLGEASRALACCEFVGSPASHVS